MIASKFIYNILDLLLDGDDPIEQLRLQLPYLFESSYEYTPMGLFVFFGHEDGIESFESDIKENLVRGVVISSSMLSLGADGTLFIKNGIIDYLEIWSYSGEYPTHELTDYVLTQKWEGAPGRQIIQP